MDDDKRIWWGHDGNNVPAIKRFLSEVKAGRVPQTLWTYDEVGHTQEAKKELIGDVSFPNSDSVFETPKPTRLLRRILQLSTKHDESALVVDFFAGSGSTAHAVFAQNAEDGGNRRFILVQLPEPLTGIQAGKLNTISELTKERLRRAGKRVREEWEAARISSEGAKARSGKGERAGDLFAESESLRGFAASREAAALPDLGFRVFKLASSNIRAWEPNRDQLAETIEASVEHLKTDRTEQDILFELLLKLGLDLTVPIETREIAREGAKARSGEGAAESAEGLCGFAASREPHRVYSVGAGTLIVCLSREILAEEVESLALGIVEWHKAQAPAGESTLVFRDSAFADDVAKTNLAAILQQHGLQNIRSL